MDNPVTDIEPVIWRLVSAPPSIQQETIERYFLRDASFTHPFCRTGSFDGSRKLIAGIYRWYQIMSGGGVDMDVHSVTFDSANLRLYVSMTQVFSIWFVPFFKARVSLITVLDLLHDPFTGKYYLKSQEDLYQTSEFIKFVLPFGDIGFALVWLWQFVATVNCLILSWIFWPVTWFEEERREHVARQLATPEVERLRRGWSAGSTAEYEREQAGLGRGREGGATLGGTGEKSGRVESVDPGMRPFETIENRDGSIGLVTAPSMEKR